MPSRPLTAALALGLLAGPPACLPRRPRPSPRFDSGPPLDLDAPMEETFPVDQPPVDRPPPTDLGAARDAGADRPAAPGDGPDPDRSYPPPPYGVQVGAVIQPFQLADCNGGTFRFDGPDWAFALATVVEFTAGYCDGCPGLARAIQDMIAGPYRAAGVRVVGVLVDGAAPGDPPTLPFCQQWIGQAGIAHPMAVDLGRTLAAHTSRLPLPQWVLTDATGRIRWRSQGTTANLGELRTRLDALLAGTP